MTNNTILNFPINSDTAFDFIWNYTIEYNFLQEELDAIKNNLKINTTYLELINQTNSISNFEETENVAEDLIDLFENIADTDDDIDEKLQEYKWKKDIWKISKIIEYINIMEYKELRYIMACIYSNDFKNKDLIIFNKNINKYLTYILNEYTTLTTAISDDVELKKLIVDCNENNSDQYKKVLHLFTEHFKDLELQIGWYNTIKDDIIKNVFLAKNGDKEARDYIIWKVIYKEADKMAKRYSLKNWYLDDELYNDLLQEAVLSSLTWLEKYNYKKNDNFIFYIRFWIKQWIHKWLENQYNEIKIPSHIIQMFSKIKNITNSWWSIELETDEIIDALIKQHITKINTKINDLKKSLTSKKWRSADKVKKEIELLKEMLKNDDYKENITKKVKNTIEKITTNSVSSIWALLDWYEDDEWNWIEANILIDDSVNLEKKIQNDEQTEAIKKLLDVVLTEEEKTVIIHRFWLFWADILLLETLGKKINKSAERVRQVYKNAKNKLSIRAFDEVVSQLNSDKKLVELSKNRSI